MSCQYFDFIPKSSSGLNTRFQACEFILNLQLKSVKTKFLVKQNNFFGGSYIDKTSSRSVVSNLNIKFLQRCYSELCLSLKFPITDLKTRKRQII